MNSHTATVMLISFLGKGEYSPASYSYPDCEPINCRYGAAAFLTYLREHENVRIDRLMICGTDSSSWILLPSYLGDLADRIFGDAGGEPEAIKEGLRNLSQGTAAGELAKLQAAPRDADFETAFSAALKAFENELNAVLKPSGLAMSLLKHAEDFSTYDRQTDLLRAIQDTGLVTGNTRVFLDITHGLRVVPFMVFMSFQSLCYTSGINISRICYSPQFMPRAEPAGRLSFIESVRNRLRFLKRTAPDICQEKLNQVKQVLNSLKKAPPAQNAGTPPFGTRKPRESKVCFLDSTEDLLLDAAAVSRFRVSLDPLEFGPNLEKSGTSWNSEDAKKLREISYRLNVCDYDAAGRLSAMKDRIKAGVGRREVSEILDKTFKWADSYAGSRDPAVRSRALKNLSARYLDAEDYLHAINSCYHAINGIEFAGLQSYRQKTELSRETERVYGDAYSKVFMKQIRAMVVHLNDKTQAMTSSGAFIHNMIGFDDDKLINAAGLKKYFDECFEKLGVSPLPKPVSRGHVMFSFIGAGDYGHASYRYCDPFHPDVRDFDVENSGAIGVSLAARLRELSASDSSGAGKAPGLTRFVVCGTRTSNWRVVLETLEQEFFRKASVSGDGGSDGILGSFLSLKKEAVESLAREDNIRGELSDECLKKLNVFFKEIKDRLGAEIVLAATGDSISDPAVQESIVSVLADNVRSYDRVSLDITHSYRIIPILSICALLYLTAVKRIRVEHIFYGDVPMETDFNVLNGLKKAQLPDDETFARVSGEISAILEDVSGADNLTGTVYDMRNLHKLVEYSAAINQYNATGNPEFLRPLIKIELRKKDFKSYVDFINGVILDNVSMFRESAKYLNPVLEKLEQGIDDPLLRTLKNDLLRSLQWVRELSDEKSDFLIRLLLQKAETALSNHNYIFCYMAAREAMRKIAAKELTFLKINCGNGRMAISGNLFVPGDKIPEDKREFIFRVNDEIRNEERKATRRGDKPQRAREIISSNSDTENSLVLSLLGRLIFGAHDWDFVRNLRNECFHLKRAVHITDQELSDQTEELGRIIRKSEKIACGDAD